jgi:triacylglycerol lipase
MTTSYPIILAHGICPFDRLMHPLSQRDNDADDRYHYFRKIRSTLIKNGFSAYHARVSWAAGIEKRASDLRKAIFEITDQFTRWPRVHIIAHSMGGLDARWMIYRFQLQGRVASLTTIGTPHLGTSYADWGMKRLGWITGMGRYLGLELRGFENLTREFCGRFNMTLKDFEKNSGVPYQTIAGVQPIERIFVPLRPSYKIIWREEGENDGLVSFTSAMWKESYFLTKMDADHLNQIGWWDRSEAVTGVDRETFERGIRDVYVMIAAALSD